MNNYPHPIIAKEGWPFLILLLVGAVGVQVLLGTWVALPWWLGLLFVIQFFRDPARQIAGTGPKSVVSPADGRIVAVEETEDAYLKRRAIKVSVFMNVFNVHSNRSPVDGVVQEVWYSPGKFVNADLAKASTENERCAMHLKTPEGQDVTSVQVAGLIARRILNYMDGGMQLARGQRYGFIRFGSRVDVYLPLDAKVKVVIGEKVYASSTLLAELA
ncbi:phosphatidylserine decarboxylase [Azovibrio restrictus]|uniref:phosphatidylserine decarboxylase n=1 Tax=Azovibrio restrictus TaxID=146938 RepID=UPI00041C41D4|nr:phosphatidylserine decarboxylase [Azovibrio restrictus]MCE1171947.1 phosphatidylserine decarboxylase [Azovibrio sp.]